MNIEFGETNPIVFDPFGSPIQVPFPVGLLSRWPEMEDTIMAKAEMIGGDVGGVFSSHLAATSAAMDKRRGVETKRRGSHVMSPTIWMTILGEASANKSSTNKTGWWPHFAIQKGIELKYKGDLEKWEVMNDNKDKPPSKFQMYTSANTFEAVFQHVETMLGSGAILRDELIGWISGFNQYRGGNGDDRQNYLELWNGSEVTRHTKTHGHLHLAFGAVSVAGTMQTDVLMTKREMFNPDGFLPRMLLSPISAMETDSDIEVKADGYDELIKRLFADRCDPMAKPHFTLTDDAYELGQTLRSYQSAQASDTTGGDLFTQFSGKAQSQIWRIAVVLHSWDVMCGNASDPDRIGLDCLMAAMNLWERYYRENARWLSYRAMEVEGEKVKRFGDMVKTMGRYIVTKELAEFTYGDMTTNVRLCRGAAKAGRKDLVERALHALSLYGWIWGADNRYAVNPEVHTSYAHVRERWVKENADVRAMIGEDSAAPRPSDTSACAREESEWD